MSPSVYDSQVQHAFTSMLYSFHEFDAYFLYLRPLDNNQGANTIAHCAMSVSRWHAEHSTGPMF